MAAATTFHAPSHGPRHGLLSPGTLLRIALAVVMVAGAAYLLLTHTEWFDDPARVKLEILSWGIWGPLAFITFYAIGPSMLVPGAVMTLAGGLAFGTLWGSFYSLIGAYLGAMIAFAAGRFLGRRFVERTVNRRFIYLMQGVARHGFQIVFYLRMVPLIPYNALNLLAGASPITFRDYFWASIIGMIPGVIVWAFLGDSMWHPASPRFALAIGLILLCVAAGEIYRRWSSIKIDQGETERVVEAN
ncbi:MAG TPA: TVP38/TMEM64 family protein [Candidatus Binataceae bacterium]|nr:TVP38/TMEM64 family protein [Candidatus Binataceae bacterium]